MCTINQKSERGRRSDGTQMDVMMPPSCVGEDFLFAKVSAGNNLSGVRMNAIRGTVLRLPMHETSTNKRRQKDTGGPFPQRGKGVQSSH